MHMGRERVTGTAKISGQIASVVSYLFMSIIMSLSSKRPSTICGLTAHQQLLPFPENSSLSQYGSAAFSWPPQAIRIYASKKYMRHQSLHYPCFLRQPTYRPLHRLIPPITPSTSPTHSSLTFSTSSLSLLASLNSPSSSLIRCS